MSRSLIISNLVLFQIGWFACVLGGAHELPWLGAFTAGLIITVHLWLARDMLSELKLLSLALLVGLIFESLMVVLQLAQYSSGMLLPVMAPVWMILMWPLFATTLNVSLRWIKPLSSWWLALMGAVLAPMAYFGGARLQAVAFNDMALSLSIIALGWALLLPALVKFAKHFNGYASEHTGNAMAEGVN